MADENRKKEINEAIRAGERALQSLRKAEEKLSSAGNWGLFDIFGGGLITNMIKHSRINEASSCLDAAKADLRTFQRELKDIHDFSELGIDVGGFLTFADFFFDGLVADVMVQSKIKEARSRVSNAAGRVESLLLKLRTINE